MTKEAGSERAAQTKQIIKEAFIELYRVKAINNISVKELTNRAGFNRGTFYIYYQDIYGLLGEIEEEILQELHKIGNKIKGYDISSFNPDEPLPALLEILKYLKSRNRYIEALLGENGDPSFSVKFKDLMKQYLFAKIKIENKEYGQYSEYLLEYMASAYIGTFIYWVQKGMEIAPEELALFLGKIVFKGPVNI